jgi:MFS family permease
VLSSSCVGSLGVIEGRYLALAAVGLAGFLEAFFFVNLITVVQLSTTERMRGRTAGLLQSLMSALAPVSVVLTGIISDLLDQDVQLIFSACGILLVSLALGVATSSDYRSFLAFELGPRPGEPRDGRAGATDPAAITDLGSEP